MEYPQFGLSGRVALVTGAARGLGRAISLALAHAGADVALGLRDVQADSGLAAEIGKMGRKVLPLQMDMTEMEQISRAVDETAKEFGRIDILVNNAGIAPENLAENVREEDFDETLAVNLKGTFCESGRRASDDPAEERDHHQHEFAGRLCGAADRVDLLHDEGGDLSSDEMFGRGMGQIRDHRERGGADLHPHSGDGGCALRSGISSRHGGTNRCAAPYRRAYGSSRGGGVSVFACCVVDHRSHHLD